MPGERTPDEGAADQSATGQGAAAQGVADQGVAEQGALRAPDEDRPPSRGSRRDARRRALEILYEADLKERPVPTVLAAHLAGDEPPPEYALALVRGVHRDAARIDELIASHAKDWTLSRMPIVDRNLLRIAVHEILGVADVPVAVAINEAVELAKELSTDDSGRFVNGVLARIAEEAEEPGGPGEPGAAPDAGA